MLSRRAVLASAAASPVAAIAPSTGGPAPAASDETHWRRVADLFDAPPPGVIH